MIESTDTTIRKRSLAEEMAVRLQEQIAQGRFEVGGKLPTESELMKIFGVGRSTVREAVKILANMGLLKVQQGAGTFVESRTARNESMERCMQRADIGDLEEVRRILEVAIVERAAQRRTQADIEKIGTSRIRRTSSRSPMSISTWLCPRLRITKYCTNSIVRPPCICRNDSNTFIRIPVVCSPPNPRMNGCCGMSSPKSLGKRWKRSLSSCKNRNL